MNINRHNYETIFLLYVDKELSAADRKAVDVFVQENPDLQIELALLQQTVFKADDIVLDKKDWLYMEDGISALQENLLLYADNELTAADKQSVENLLRTDTAALAEWNILKQTRLEADTSIIFADKQSLYRKEAGRVVGIKWWRVAAAAVLLGFGLWTGVSLYKNYTATTTSPEALVNSKNTRQEQKKSVIPVDVQTNETAPEEKSATENNAVTTSQENNKKAGNENINTAAEKINKQNTVDPKESIAVQNNSNKKPNNNLPKPYFENINSNESNKIEAIAVSDLNNSSRVSGSNDAVVITRPNEKIKNTVVPNLNRINTADPTTTAAIQVVNNKTDDENDRYLDVDDDKEKRTALGGFLRKAKRVLERTTNVKTGEGIKIAGFEIALK